MFFLSVYAQRGRVVINLEPTWSILDFCIPKGTAEKLARLLGKSTETINRWKRPQEADDSPYGTGANNPMDWLESIQDHAFAHAPGEAHRIHLYFQRRYEKFTSSFSAKPATPEQRDKELADVVREQSELLQAILNRLPADRVRAEWEQLKREGEELVRMIEGSISSELQNVRRVK